MVSYGSSGICHAFEICWNFKQPKFSSPQQQISPAGCAIWPEGNSIPKRNEWSYQIDKFTQIYRESLLPAMNAYKWGHRLHKWATELSDELGQNWNKPSGSWHGLPLRQSARFSSETIGRRIFLDISGSHWFKEAYVIYGHVFSKSLPSFDFTVWARVNSSASCGLSRSLDLSPTGVSSLSWLQSFEGDECTQCDQLMLRRGRVSTWHGTWDMGARNPHPLPYPVEVVKSAQKKPSKVLENDGNHCFFSDVSTVCDLQEWHFLFRSKGPSLSHILRQSHGNPTSCAWETQCIWFPESLPMTSVGNILTISWTKKTTGYQGLVQNPEPLGISMSNLDH